MCSCRYDESGLSVRRFPFADARFLDPLHLRFGGQFDDGFGYKVIVVAEDLALVEEVAHDGFYAEGADAFKVGLDGLLAFGGILREGVGPDRAGVDQGIVEDARTGVVEDLFDVFGGGEVEAFIGLGHEIADVDARRCGGSQGFRDAAYEKVADHGGVERARAEGDEVGGGDGVEGFGQRIALGGVDHEFNDAGLCGGDAGFAANHGAVLHLRHEHGVGGGRGVNAAARGEDLRGSLDGLGEIAAHFRQCSEEEIAEAVAFEIAGVEAVLKELCEKGFVLGEGNHAVADVTGGEDVHVLAQAAGGATVIGDGDDRGEIADAEEGGLPGFGAAAVLEAEGRVGWLREDLGCGRKALQATQQGGEAGATADGNDAEGADVLCGRTHHEQV